MFIYITFFNFFYITQSSTTLNYNLIYIFCDKFLLFVDYFLFLWQTLLYARKTHYIINTVDFNIIKIYLVINNKNYILWLQ